MNKAVFLDRDGTLIKDIPYLKDPKGVAIIGRALPALRMLQDQGYKLIIITNQSGIGRGLITEEEYEKVEERLDEILQTNNITLTATYYSPYHPEKAKGEYLQDSDCRKPKPGMILKGMKDHDIDPKNAVMIGDKISDIEAGHNAGIKSILVRTGEGKSALQEYKANPKKKKPEFIAEDFFDAVINYILP